MRPSLRGLVVPDKYDRNFSKMDKGRLLELGLQTLWEVEGGNKNVLRPWEAIRSKLLAITDLNELLYRTTTMVEEYDHESLEAEIQGFPEI